MFAVEGKVVCGVVGMGLWLLVALPVQAQMIKSHEVIKASEQQLRAMLEESESDLRVERVFFRDELALPDGKVSWSVTSKPEELNPGRQKVAVKVIVDGKEVREIQVTATLNQLVKYLTVRRPLKRGDLVTEEELTWEEVEVNRPMSTQIVDPKHVVGQVAMRSIQKGKPLQPEWFGIPYVVARGDRVQVALEQGSLLIETIGVAQSAGRVGETIQFENPDSRRRYDARILGPGRAQALKW